MTAPASGRGDYDAVMNLPRVAVPLVLVLAALASCAPSTGTTPAAAVPPADVDELPAVERTAWEAWHLMEIGRLRTGAYTTNVLVDLPLPQGVRWTVLGFEEGSYLLGVSGADGTEGFEVDPSGVRPAR